MKKATATSHGKKRFMASIETAEGIGSASAATTPAAVFFAMHRN
jgi:hypothetical protein